MSRTVRKNGQLIEQSLKRLCHESEFAIAGKPFVSVGQVANDTGKSKPTCRKYLEMLVKSGCAEWLNLRGMIVYSSLSL